MKRRYWETMALVMVTAFIITGCGSRPTGNVSEELSRIEEQSGQTMGKNGLAKLLQVTENRVSYVVGGTSNEGCTVDADIDVPNAESVAIYNQEPRQMTAGEVKELAEGLFEKGSCQAVRPFAAYDEKELSEAFDSFKEQALAVRKQARDAGETDWMMESRALDYQVNDTQMLLYEYEEKPKEWKKDEFYPLKDGSRILIYQGLIGEVTYYLVAVGDAQENQVKIYLYQQGEPWSQFPTMLNASYKEVLIDELNDTLYGKNQCILTLEDARQTAQVFLERFGLVNMVMADERSAVPMLGLFYAYEEEVVSDDHIYDGVSESGSPTGYSFYFVRSYDGVPMEYNGYEGASVWEPETGTKQPTELYHVIVTSEGVAFMEIDAIYDVKDALTEQSTLLSFEQIDNIAREKLADVPGEVNRVEFRYRNVEYDGQSVLMPVWIYGNSYQIDSVHGDVRYQVLVLNAVDGSEIYKEQTTK